MNGTECETQCKTFKPDRKTFQNNMHEQRIKANRIRGTPLSRASASEKNDGTSALVHQGAAQLMVVGKGGWEARETRFDIISHSTPALMQLSIAPVIVGEGRGGRRAQG